MNHLTTQQLESYRNGTIEAIEEYLSIEAHLAECAECRERLGADSRRLPEELRRLLIDQAHPSGSELVRYAQNNAGVSAMISQHVAVCERCRQDVAALQTYRQRVTPEIWEEARQTLETWAARPRWRDRLRLSLGTLGAKRFVRLGAPVMAICLILLAVFFWRRQPVLEVVDGGGRWTITRGGDLTGPLSVPKDLEPTVRLALRERHAATPAALAALASAGTSGYNPTGTIVRDDQPRLSWASLPEAVSYQCTLTSPDDLQFKRSAPKPIQAAFWKPKKALPRGQVYTWQVVATLRNGQRQALTGAPRFKVMDLTEAQRLDQAAKTYGRSHLMLGLLYAQAGDLDEAEQEFTALQRANPGSPVVRTLLERLQAAHRPGA